MIEAFLHIFGIVFGVLGFSVVLVLFVKDVDRTIQPVPSPLQTPTTNLERLIKQYMKRDACDPTSTINFLLEADKLKDPFEEAPILPPPKPADAATSAKPPCVQCGKLHKGRSNEEHKSLEDDIMSAFGVPTHYLGGEPCSQCGYPDTVGGGVCKLCGHHARWRITDVNGHVMREFGSEQRAIKCAYRMQKEEGIDFYVIDDRGRRKIVAKPPRLIEEIIKKPKVPYRDANGRFCKAPDPFDEYCASIHPLDEPYPIEIIQPPNMSKIVDYQMDRMLSGRMIG